MDTATSAQTVPKARYSCESTTTACNGFCKPGAVCIEAYLDLLAKYNKNLDLLAKYNKTLDQQHDTNDKGKKRPTSEPNTPERAKPTPRIVIQHTENMETNSTTAPTNQTETSQTQGNAKPNGPTNTQHPKPLSYQHIINDNKQTNKDPETAKRLLDQYRRATQPKPQPTTNNNKQTYKAILLRTNGFDNKTKPISQLKRDFGAFNISPRHLTNIAYVGTNHIEIITTTAYADTLTTRLKELFDWTIPQPHRDPEIRKRIKQQTTERHLRLLDFNRKRDAPATVLDALQQLTQMA